MGSINELEDLRAFKLLALELANRKGFDSVAVALDSIDCSQKMKSLIEITSKYRSMYAAAKALNVTAMQLKRLVDKGALVDDEGNVYIKSATKIELKNE